jgi:DNA-binding PadR family transcriptional regulator
MSLRHALLGLLAEHPASGYDLLKQFEGSLAFVWPATQSQLYTELGRLADGGLIEVSAHGARGRKEYALTADGRAELERWLRDTVPDRTIRDERVLRTFFLWAVDPAVARDYFEAEAAVTQRYLDRLQDIADTVEFRDTGPDRFRRIALEDGLRRSAAYVAWAQWATEHVTTPPPPLAARSTAARRP